MHGEHDVDGGQEDAPAQRVQPAGDEEGPEDREQALEHEAESEEEHGETAAPDGEDGEEDQDEVGELVVEVVEGQPGGADLLVVLQQVRPVLSVQPAQQTGEAGVGHSLAHLQSEIMIITARVTAR